MAKQIIKVTTTIIKDFIHEKGNVYEFVDFTDCGRYVVYSSFNTKTKKRENHLVHRDDTGDWEELRKLYPPSETKGKWVFIKEEE